MKNLLCGLFSPNYLWDQKDWHYKWKTAQNKDTFIKIHKSLPEEVRYKTQSFHLSVCFGMLTGDRLLTVMTGREEVVGISTDTLHTCDSHQRRGCHFKQRVLQVPVLLLHLGNADAIAGQTCRQSRNLCQRQAESWTAAATRSAPQGCSSLCADIKHSGWLYVLVCFGLACADWVSRTPVTLQHILQNTYLFPHYPLNW